MSTTQDVDGLRASVDLAAYIGQYVELKREGNELVACCPFHTEDTPSFKVNSVKQVWACFGCGQQEQFGADVFGFIRSYENCSFPEALEKLKHGSNGASPPIPRAPLKKAPKRELLVPPEGSHPNTARDELGDISVIWQIHTRDGRPWFYEARYLKEGAKETRFWTYGRYSESDPPRWECKHPPNPRPFYGLEALDLRPAAQVMVHEAPKKAEAARVVFPQQVHIAMLGGAQQVANMDIEPLRGRKLILLPDNDEAGRQAMARLAARLVQELGAESVRGIDPQYQPDGSISPEAWDIADAQGWTPKIALDWAKKNAQTYNAAPDAGQEADPPPPAPAPVAAPEKTAQIAPGSTIAAEPTPTPRPNLMVVEGGAVRKPRQELEPEAEQLPAFSEFALAKRFAEADGQDWRYTAAWSTWARWIGHRWEPDEVRAITWAVKDCCKAAMQEHLNESSPPQRMRLTTLKTVNAVATLAGSDPQIAVAAREWDADPMLLGTPAGVVDLRTGALVPAARSQLISKSTSVIAAPGPHPWWNRVLERGHKGDAELAGLIHRWCGYMLTGDTREERFLFIHGPGAGGKSKFIAPLSEILGDYRRAAKMESFTARERSEHSEEIARLAGARLVTATETAEGSRWNESRITALTGRDAIAARHMHKSTFEFLPQFKLVFIGNHRPALRSVGEEMRRRIDLIEWGGTIPEAERVLDLPDKLRAEYPAILAWMIDGCLAWQREGLGKPMAVEAATREYLSAEDTFGAWLEECVTVDAKAYCKSGTAYASFKEWAERAGEFAPSQKRFSQIMVDRGFQLRRTSTERQFLGFSLKASGYEPAPADWLP